MQKENKGLNEKQKEILTFLYRFRYLTRVQIQILLRHKTWTKIIIWLNALTNEKYIYRIYKKQAVSKPAVHCLDKKSIAYFTSLGGDRKTLKYIYHEKNNPELFQYHCIFTAAIYLSLLSLTKKTKSKLAFYTKRDLSGMQYLPHSHPDCYFAITDPDGTIKRYFLDIFDTKTFLYKRFHQYAYYHNSEYWQEKTNKSFPRIIFVCPDEKAKKSITRYMINELTENSPTFYVTTKKEIEEGGLRKEILQKVMLDG